MPNATYVDDELIEDTTYGVQSVTVATPKRYSPGNLFIALALQAGAGGLGNLDAPSGWNVVLDETGFGFGGVIAVATHVAVSGEPVNCTFTTGAAAAGGLLVLILDYSFSSFNGAITAGIDDIEINTGTQTFPTARAGGSNSTVLIVPMGAVPSSEGVSALQTPTLPGEAGARIGWTTVGSNDPGYWAGMMVGEYLASQPGVISPGSTTGNTNPGLGNITITLRGQRSGFFAFF